VNGNDFGNRSHSHVVVFPFSSLFKSNSHSRRIPWESHSHGNSQSPIPIRHVARNYEGGSPPPPLSFPPFALFPPLPSLLPSLRSRHPVNQLGGLGELCKLPQRGLGRSPSRNRFWCILASKSGICWQHF